MLSLAFCNKRSVCSEKLFDFVLLQVELPSVLSNQAVLVSCPHIFDWKQNLKHIVKSFVTSFFLSKPHDFSYIYKGTRIEWE